MTILHARVENGRVIVDESTELPDGVRVELLVLDAVEEDSAASVDDERALHASLVRGLQQLERGNVLTGHEVLARLQRI